MAFLKKYLYIDNLHGDPHPSKNLRVFGVERIGSYGGDAVYVVSTTLDEDFSDRIDECLIIEAYPVIISEEVLLEWYKNKVEDLKGVEEAFYKWGGLFNENTGTV